jgi:Ser/Thr protein kinase RdoA (MazF antagonist)
VSAVAAAEAERIARERFGLEARATALTGELDFNFALDGAGGQHVLKLYAPGTAPELLDLQDAALEHLAGRVAVPRLVRTVEGAARSQEGDRLARMLTWLPGTPWGADPQLTPELLASLGRTVAAIDTALADFDHPSLAGRRRWNMTAAGELFAGAPGDAATVLERFDTEVLPRLSALPAQAIHNDANEHNVLVGDDGRVSGLIDFGDLCRAPRACGLAVACAYAMAMLPVPERQVLALVAGYHELAALDPGELALLPDLIRTRLAMSIAMAARQHREQPGNEYLLISQQSVPELLRRLGPVPSELELLRLRSACGY